MAGRQRRKRDGHGLFGQAQEVKIYLISALAAGENGRLESDLGGHTLDYQTHINPESHLAGLVTRFTVSLA
ncbi:MAG: virulence factor SrfC family protein [Symbiopectobacterium sp.]